MSEPNVYMCLNLVFSYALFINKRRKENDCVKSEWNMLFEVIIPLKEKKMLW